MGKGKPRQGGEPRGRKRPAVAARPEAARRPHLAPTAGDHATLAWRIGTVDRNGPWGWDKVTQSELVAIHERCADWETMRQGEFFGPGGNKLIPTDHLCPRARARLEELELDDVDGLWELRVGGQPRVWGFRLDNVFRFLWWDPRHEVCPSTKRGN